MENSNVYWLELIHNDKLTNVAVTALIRAAEKNPNLGRIYFFSPYKQRNELDSKHLVQLEYVTRENRRNWTKYAMPTESSNNA
jgi:hypothetical protein